MRKLLTIVLISLSLCFVLTNIIAKSTPSLKKVNTLPAQIDKVIAHRMPNANIGMIVMDAKTGKILYDLHGFQPFTAASNTKLFVSSAALYYLGPKFRYTTTLKLNPKKINKQQLNGNLYITFSGDPSLKVKDLKQLLAAIKKQGINMINGNIVLDTTMFRAPNYAPGTSVDDLPWSYAAPTTALTLNQNSAYIRITPSITLGRPAKVMPGKYTRFAQFSANVKTVTAHFANTHCSLHVSVNHQNNIKITGCWPITNTSKHFNVAFRNPNLFAKKMIRYQLKKLRIAFKGKIILGKTPKKLKTIAQHQSRTLSVLLKCLLKDSNNVYAESLTKTLGYQYYKRGTFQDGVNVIRHVLHKKTAIDFGKMTLVDGAGTRYNLISPRQISRLLFVVYHSPKIKNHLIKALPYAGRDGTLKRRMKSFDMAKQIQAKTGTMKGVSALSGYLTTLGHRKLIFSILVNHIVGSTRQARSLQNELCNLMVTS